MHLRYAQRHLLSRCNLRWYSVGTVPASNTSDPVVASGVVPRLKRPLASSFGGIDIKNVVMPTQKPRGGTNRSPRTSGGSDDKSRDMRMRRSNQADRFRGHGKPGASSSGWDDGLVSLSFSNRLRHHQEKMTTRDTGLSTEAQPRKQQYKQYKQAQRPQMHGHRQEQRDPSPDKSHQHPRDKSTKSAGARQKYENRTSATDDAKSKASSMTRSSASSFSLHARQTKTTSTTVGAPKAKHVVSKEHKANNPSSTSNAATAQPTTTATALSSADRSARLTALSSTNLNALFRTRDTPTAGAGVSLPLPSGSHASVTTRVRSVLERSAGDYSRFLPRHVGVRKNASRLPALRTARHALAVQRDVSLKQRRIALHIIGGLAQPNRAQARA